MCFLDDLRFEFVLVRIFLMKVNIHVFFANPTQTPRETQLKYKPDPMPQENTVSMQTRVKLSEKHSQDANPTQTHKKTVQNVKLS